MTFTVYHGDALEKLRTMAAESVDAVVTDPPYGMDFQSSRRVESDKLPKIANDKQPFIWWLHDAYRVTKPGGGGFCVFAIGARRKSGAQRSKRPAGTSSLRSSGTG